MIATKFDKARASLADRTFVPRVKFDEDGDFFQRGVVCSNVCAF